MYAIEATALSKTFIHGKRRLFRKTGGRTKMTAVDQLSFQIETAEFVGFLGPNGAGKSTTIKMLTGILHPTAGAVAVHGISPQKHRIEVAKRIGAVFGQRTQLWWDLPLLESFRILRALYKVPKETFAARLQELEDTLQLSEFWHTPVRQLSLGQRMRGELTAALLHQPEVLFLDEPTIGLDVTAKVAVRQFLRHINRQYGTTIILTTHDMSDVEELCSRILVIDHGHSVFDGTPLALTGRVGLPSNLVARFRQRTVDHLAIGAWTVQDEGDSMTVTFDRQQNSPVEILTALQAIGTLEDFVMTDPRLEDVIDRLYSGI